MSSISPTLKYTPDEGEPLSSAIVSALSEAKGRDVSDDGCVLYDAIDLDALDDMFRQERDGDALKIEFTTHDAIVILWGNGKISIEVQDLESDPNR